jgi:hypothetical protein
MASGNTALAWSRLDTIRPGCLPATLLLLDHACLLMHAHMLIVSEGPAWRLPQQQRATHHKLLRCCVAHAAADGAYRVRCVHHQPEGRPPPCEESLAAVCGLQVGEHSLACLRGPAAGAGC